MPDDMMIMMIMRKEREKVLPSEYAKNLVPIGLRVARRLLLKHMLVP